MKFMDVQQNCQVTAWTNGWTQGEEEWLTQDTQGQAMNLSDWKE